MGNVGLKIRSPILIKLAAVVFTAAMWLLFRTLKLDFREDRPDTNPYSPSTRNCFLYCVWHDSMIVPTFGGKHRRTAALTSQHTDGSFVAQVLRLVGISTIRGSTNRISPGTIRTLIKTAEDKHIVITPDGPRGPRREMSVGIASGITHGTRRRSHGLLVRQMLENPGELDRSAHPQAVFDGLPAGRRSNRSSRGTGQHSSPGTCGLDSSGDGSSERRRAMPRQRDKIRLKRWLAYTQQHDIVSLALVARIVQRLGAPHRVVNFSAVDWHILGSIEPKSDLVTSNLDHHHDYVVVDDDALVLFAGQHEHCLSFSPGSSRLTRGLDYRPVPRRLLFPQPFLV